MANETVPLDVLTCRWSLLRQNPYLRPDVLPATGLITAKSLSVPRYSAIDGAYYGKIPYLCPDILPATGLITAKFLSAPRYSSIDGAYYGKILIYAPISRCRWGLLRQNSFLRSDIPVSTGLITAKSLSAPRCTNVEGIIDLV